MNKMAGTILLIAASYAMIGFGAYQYIISTDPALAVNPSESAYSSPVSVNVDSSDDEVDAAALETRYCATSSVPFAGSKFRRTKPGVVLFIR